MADNQYTIKDNVPTNPLDYVEKDIKAKVSQKPTDFLWNYEQNQKSQDFFKPFSDNRINTQNYIIDQDEVYTTLSSGAMNSKYPNYIQGTDNNERLASQQSTGEKWSNGLQKFGGKTLNSVLGGTAGIVYGVGSWITEGNFSAVYNNSFSNWLNDLDTKMNNQLANYYKKQEQDLGLFGQMGTANFWSDKVLGGLSFTTGAIISEGIWAATTGGLSLIVNPMKWAAKGIGTARVAKGVSGMKEVMKSVLRPTTVQGANNVGRGLDALNLVRFTTTSAGYESSVEALQFRKEQQELFYHNFKEMNGRMPSAEEEADFRSNLESAANSVFATNMAIVGSSNLVTMGNIFKIKSPIKADVFADVRKSIYGIGKEASELTRLHKFNRVSLPLIKNMVTEGLYEEGSQSMTSNVAGQWLNNTYDENAVENSFNLSGALYEAFSEQYGTKEGWVENGVGMIIGLLGEGFSGNTRNELKKEITDYTSRQKLQETYTPKVVSEAFLNANRVSSFNRQAEEAESRGNLTEARIAQDGTIISMLTNRHQLGDSMSEVALDVEAGLNTVTQEQLKEMGINEDVNSWRQTQLEAFNSISKSFSSNREFAERIIGRGTTIGLGVLDADNALSPLKVNNQEALVQSLTFSLMAGQRANSVMEEATNEMGRILGDQTKTTLDVVTKLSTLSDSTRKKVANVKVKINALRQKAVSLNKELLEVTNMPDSEKGNVEKGNRILNITNQIAATQERLSIEEASAIELTNSINLANNSINETGTLKFDQVADFTSISLEDILSLDENVKKLEQSISTMREVSPETASRLESILNEHNNARKAFQNYSNSVKMFQDGTFDLKSVNTKLGKLLNKNTKLDDANREWLAGILSDYTRRVVDNLGSGTNLQTQQDVEITTDSVLDKRRRGASLTPEEQLFYQENKSEIDTRLKQEPLPPIVEETTPKLTNAEYLKQRIDSIISRLDNATIPVDNLQTPPNKPTVEDVEEYKGLLDKQYFEPLTGEETLRLEELANTLGAWKVLDSYLDSESGMTLADMTELLAQTEQEIQEVETVKRLDPEDILASTSDADAFESKTDYSLGQNVLASATVKKNADGTLTLHHVDPLNILSEAFTVDRKGKILNSPDRVEPLDKVLDSTGLEFTVDESRNIKLTTDNFNKLGFTIVNSGTVNWSYSDIYEFNGSESVKRKSDYTEPGLQSEYIADVEIDQEVRFEIDRNDTHTKNLLEKFEKNPSEANRKALQDGIKIFIIVNGKKVSVLKGQRNLSQPAFANIRSEAFRTITEEVAVNDIGVKSTVKGVFLGSPQLFISESGEVETKPFTDSSLDKVLSTGYIQDGEVTLSNSVSGEVNKTYVGKVSQRNKGKKLPIVVVKRGIHFIALPIQLNTYSLTEQEVDEIMGTVYNSANEAEAAKALNLIIQNNSLTKITKVLPNQVSDNKVEEVRNALLALENTISAEQLTSKNYDKSGLKTDAQMYIDIDNLNQVIKDFKIRVDIEGAILKQPLDFDVNDSKTSIEEQLNDIALSLQTDLMQNSTTKYVDSKGNDYEHKYIEVFDNTPIEKGTSSIIKQKNVKTLREAFSHNPGKSKILKSAITQDTIDKVEQLFKALDKIKEQTKVNSENKKSGKDNTNCKS